jgi:hypothetical protein
MLPPAGKEIDIIVDSTFASWSISDIISSSLRPDHIWLKSVPFTYSIRTYSVSASLFDVKEYA